MKHPPTASVGFRTFCAKPAARLVLQVSVHDILRLNKLFAIVLLDISEPFVSDIAQFLSDSV